MWISSICVFIDTVISLLPCLLPHVLVYPVNIYPIERYIVYTLLDVFPVKSPIMYLVATPVFFNIVHKVCGCNYYLHREIFIKYLLSKLMCKGLTKLHPDIKKIQVYHTFLIYRVLDLQLFMSILQNMAITSILMILRNYPATYYYYKGVKLAYYNSTGYMFNLLTEDNAVFILNTIITEKRWNELYKIEVSNAIITLITKNKRHEYNPVVYFYKLLLIWFIVDNIKLKVWNVDTIFIMLCILFYPFMKWITKEIYSFLRYHKSIIRLLN